MPWLPRHPCAHPNCPELLDAGARYCVKHTTPARIWRAPDTRESSSKRGYNYAWQKFRKWFLSKHPLCLDCLDRGIYMPAVDIHHLTKLRADKSKKYDESNLRPLCGDCHKARTAKGE